MLGALFGEGAALGGDCVLGGEVEEAGEGGAGCGGVIWG